MGRVTLTLPRLGETMEEAKVTDWLVAPGTAFRRGDVLLEVETDKTVVEVPALTDGVMAAHLVAPGDTVALDQPIAEVEAEASEPVEAPAEAVAPTAPPPQSAPAVTRTAPSSRPAASPAARAAARRSGTDLTVIAGSGRRGRITAADVAAADGGGAATAVLLHGLFDTPQGWRDLPRRLAEAGLAVATPALPAPDATPALDGIAAGLEADLPAGPLALVGHSLGAAVAVALARRLGPRVRRLVLLAPAGIGARINPDFVGGMLAAETPAALARALALLDAGPVSETALAAELDRLRARRPADAALAGLLARGGFQQIDVTGDLDALGCPAAVVFGTADRVLDWHAVEALPATVSIHLVRGAGHLPHLAAPALVARLARGGPIRQQTGIAGLSPADAQQNGGKPASSN